jgi:hypothetical protein
LEILLKNPSEFRVDGTEVLFGRRLQLLPQFGGKAGGKGVLGTRKFALAHAVIIASRGWHDKHWLTAHGWSFLAKIGAKKIANLILPCYQKSDMMSMSDLGAVPKK